MTGIKKLLCEGKEILYVDYRGLTDVEMAETVKTYKEIALQNNKEFLSLSNITDAYATPVFLKEANKFATETKHLLKKGAIVGIKGAKKILLKTFNLFLGDKGLRPFDTEDEALRWLIS